MRGLGCRCSIIRWWGRYRSGCVIRSYWLRPLILGTVVALFVGEADIKAVVISDWRDGDICERLRLENKPLNGRSRFDFFDCFPGRGSDMSTFDRRRSSHLWGRKVCRLYGREMMPWPNTWFRSLNHISGSNGILTTYHLWKSTHIVEIYLNPSVAAKY